MLQKLTEKIIKANGLENAYTVGEYKIGLEDVLRTYDKTDKIHRDECGYKMFLEINQIGMFCGSAYNWEEEPYFWQLGKSLDEQTPELHKFLLEIL